METSIVTLSITTNDDSAKPTSLEVQLIAATVKNQYQLLMLRQTTELSANALRAVAIAMGVNELNLPSDSPVISDDQILRELDRFVKEMYPSLRIGVGLTPVESAAP